MLNANQVEQIWFVGRGAQPAAPHQATEFTRPICLRGLFLVSAVRSVSIFNHPISTGSTCYKKSGSPVKDLKVRSRHSYG